MKHSEEFLALVNDAKSRIREVDIDGYKQMLAEGTPHILIDVREEIETQISRIPGAQVIPLFQLPARLSEISPDAEVVLFCRTGVRSGRAGGSAGSRL